MAVARALAGRPRLILADEPTGQLDHAAAGLVVDALLLPPTDLGAGLVLTTHDPVVAARVPTRWADARRQPVDTMSTERMSTCSG